MTTAARRIIHAETKEAVLQNWAIEYAHVKRWRVFAMKDSRAQWWGTDKGFPDLFLVRDGHAIAAELKTMTGRTRDGQEEWHAALSEVPGIWTPPDGLWRPDDEDEIRRVLA